VKLILSRKGFDSACGGVASPIFPTAATSPCRSRWASRPPTALSAGGTPADRHLLSGWLRVGEVLRVGHDGPEAVWGSHPWLAYHPHLSGRRPEANNAVYVAAERLRLPGGGVFAQARDALVLTAPGQRLRSVWSLPGRTRDCRLSFHADPSRWRADGIGLRLHAVDQGQEFVADLADRPEAPSWLAGLFGGEAARLPQSSSHSGSASSCSLVMSDTRCSPSSRS
jgi:hypothetical protein